MNDAARPLTLAGRLGPIVAFALTSACADGCKNDHPYVPYSIEGSTSPEPTKSAPPQAASVVDAAAQPPAAGDGAAIPAPAAVSQWAVGGVEMTAPPGRFFVLGLAGDFDADGARDAVAIVRDKERANDPGELLWFHTPKGGAPRADSLLASTDVPTEPSCVPSPRLAAAGGRAIYAELGITCAARAAGGPTRVVALGEPAVLADPARAGTAALVALVTDPPSAPALTITPDGSDQDGDGKGDAMLRVKLVGGGAPFEPGPAVTGTLRWLTRASGLSRDGAATEASLATLAAEAMDEAGKGKAATVPPLVQQIRALYRAMCPDAGAPRIARRGDAGTSRCGTSRALEEAGLAEVRAHVTLHDPVRAIAAFDRAQRAPAARTKAREATARGWIEQAAPPRALNGVRTLAVVPAAFTGRAPAWSPLAFEAGGKLLVRTATGIVRVDVDRGEESPAESAAPWRSAVTSPDAQQTWIEAYDPCDGIALRATFAPNGSGDPRDVILPVAPPFGDRCRDARGVPATVTPIAWGPRGLEAIVAGEPLLLSSDLTRASAAAALLDQPAVPGSPRSPDGKWLIVPTTVGLLVRGPARTHLVRGIEQGDPPRACVVADDGARIACVRGGRVVTGTWSP